MKRDMNYSYFKELNQKYNEAYETIDPELYSENLIEDLFLSLLSQETAKGYRFKLLGIKRAIDGKRRYFAKVRVDIDDNTKYIFGVSADFIGVAVNQYLNARVNRTDIDDDLINTRVLGGYIVFPLWFQTNGYSSHELYETGISINEARQGMNKYQNRFDYTLYAIKNEYEQSEKSTKLRDIMNRNSIWFKLFGTFEDYVKYFKLEWLVNENNEVYNLMSYNEAKKCLTSVIKDDSNNDKIELSLNTGIFEKYMHACREFIEVRSRAIEELRN